MGENTQHREPKPKRTGTTQRVMHGGKLQKAHAAWGGDNHPAKGPPGRPALPHAPLTSREPVTEVL